MPFVWTRPLIASLAGQAIDKRKTKGNTRG